MFFVLFFKVHSPLHLSNMSSPPEGNKHRSQSIKKKFNNKHTYQYNCKSWGNAAYGYWTPPLCSSKAKKIYHRLKRNHDRKTTNRQMKQEYHEWMDYEITREEITEYSEEIDSEEDWCCIYCDALNPSETAFCRLCERKFIHNDSRNIYIPDDLDGDDIDTVKTSYSQFRKHKKKKSRRRRQKQMESTTSSYGHFNSFHLDSHDGLIYKHYRDGIESKMYVDRLKRKLHGILRPHIRRLFDFVTMRGQRCFDILVDCTLNDFWIRSLMNDFDDISDRIIFLRKRPWCFQQETWSFFREIGHRDTRIDAETVGDVLRYHPIIRMSKMDSFVAAYLTRHDVAAFVPNDVLRVCMSFCGVISYLLPSYDGWMNRRGRNAKCKVIDIDYRSFIEFSVTSIEPQDWRTNTKGGYSRDIWDCGACCRGYQQGDSFEFVVCAVIDDQIKNRKSKGIRYEAMLPLYTVRVAKTSGTSRVLWIGMSKKYQRMNSLATVTP